MTTSKLSQGTLFEVGQAGGESISSPAGSRVSPFLSPGSAWARRMTAISGQKCSGSLTSFGPIECLVKTLLESSRWGSTLCYLTWNRSVTPAGRSLFRLRPSAPPTAGIASGFLPTPQAQEPGISHELLVDKHGNRPTHMNQRLYHRETGRNAQDSLTQYVGFWPTPDTGMVAGGRVMPEGTTPTGMTPDGKKVQVGLTNAVRMWPTPRHEGFDAGSHRGNPDSLHSAVKAARSALGETPSASDNRDRGHANMPAIKRRIEMGKQVMLSMQVQQAKGQKLSAAWVSRLMGYPDGWLDLTD